MAVRSVKYMSLDGSGRGVSLFGASAFPGDFESIATVTVGSGGLTTASFTSIPSTYQHLQLRLALADNGLTNGMRARLKINSSTTNYYSHLLRGEGSSATAFASSSNSNGLWLGGLNNAVISNAFEAIIVDILDYANTSKNTVIRSFSGYDSNGSGEIYLASGLLVSTAAVSTLEVNIDGNTNAIGQYSSLALYGIKA